MARRVPSSRLPTLHQPTSERDLPTHRLASVLPKHPNFKLARKMKALRDICRVMERRAELAALLAAIFLINTEARSLQVLRQCGLGCAAGMAKRRAALQDGQPVLKKQKGAAQQVQAGPGHADVFKPAAEAAGGAASAARHPEPKQKPLRPGKAARAAAPALPAALAAPSPAPTLKETKRPGKAARRRAAAATQEAAEAPLPGAVPAAAQPSGRQAAGAAGAGATGEPAGNGLAEAAAEPGFRNREKVLLLSSRGITHRCGPCRASAPRIPPLPQSCAAGLLLSSRGTTHRCRPFRASAQRAPLFPQSCTLLSSRGITHRCRPCRASVAAGPSIPSVLHAAVLLLSSRGTTHRCRPFCASAQRASLFPQSCALPRPSSVRAPLSGACDRPHTSAGPSAPARSGPLCPLSPARCCVPAVSARLSEGLQPTALPALCAGRCLHAEAQRTLEVSLDGLQDRAGLQGRAREQAAVQVPAPAAGPGAAAAAQQEGRQAGHQV